MSGAAVGFALARADHRFRARNYVKVPAKNWWNATSQETLNLTFTHHLHKLISLSIFYFMDRSILAPSHFIDLSYKTETLVKPPTLSGGCLFPYVTVFQAFYSDITTNHAVCMLLAISVNQCFQLKWPCCYKSSTVFFFYVSAHHRSNWQLLVYLQKELVGRINGMNITKVKTGGGPGTDSLPRCSDRGGTVATENMESVVINGVA